MLRYTLTFAADGTIDGTFAGIPVRGSHLAHAQAGPLQARGGGGSAAGVFTLTVHGQALVLGTYECGGGECSIMGEEVAGRLRSFLVFTDRLTGTFRGSLTGLYPDEGAWLHALRRWAEAALTPEQADPAGLGARTPDAIALTAASPRPGRGRSRAGPREPGEGRRPLAAL